MIYWNISRYVRGALYTSVFAVRAIVNSPSSMTAIRDLRLTSRAIHPVKPYATSSLPISTAAGSGWKAKLPADHVSVIYIPSIVTDGAPFTASENLHPPS